MLAATVVLAFPGLPAIIVISPLVIPVITLSNVPTPVCIKLVELNIESFVDSSSEFISNVLFGCSFIILPIVV